LKADYINTIGENIRQYIKKPIYLKPLETIEIVINEQDIEGGSGANFIFDWTMKNEKNPPLFEAVMISTYGQQGLSFTTRGVPVLE
jgi:5,10-methenyltetrahydromethanopterin hydrogenase